MSKKIVCFLAVIACTVAAFAAPAHARRAAPPVIVFGIQNVGDGTAACPGAFFGLSFDLQAPSGSLLGTGVSCVHSLPECQTAGCRETIHATFTLRFGNGSPVAPVVLDESWVTDSLVVQRTTGRIATGTGAFAGARCTLNCVGTIRFTDTGVIPKLVCIVRLV
jgi:hypothetical protein